MWAKTSEDSTRRKLPRLSNLSARPVLLMLRHSGSGGSGSTGSQG